FRDPAVAISGEDPVDDAHPGLEGGVVVAHQGLDAARYLFDRPRLGTLGRPARYDFLPLSFR
ncbi:hypothetical protein QLR68_19955, partial [Micromonospora sp. DH15]|nr:hypothetical protein [Micromonospora sp. DH15]